MFRRVPAAAPSARQARCLWQAMGFTLLELLVVLVIALMALGVVLPRFSALLPGVELKGASQQMAALLRQFRSQAIAESREITLQLVSPQPTTEEEGLSPGDQPERLLLSDGKREYGVPDSVVMTYIPAQSDIYSNDTDVIRFYPDGSSTGGTLTLSDGHRQYRIEISWLTGKVSIDGGSAG